MHAILQNETGNADTLMWGETEVPVPLHNQLLVRVRAAGVNRADIVQREGKYPPPPGAPHILGLEIAGEIAALGPDCVGYEIGDAVFGLVAGGAYAEYALLDKDLAIKKPLGWSWEQAASLPEAWMTAWFNLVEIGGLRAGQTVLIHAGASGVGSAAVQLCKWLGAKAIVTAGSDEKCRYCESLGAASAINYHSHPGFDHIVKAQGGADLVLDCVGASYLERNLASLKYDGTLIVIGGMSGRQAQLDLGMLLVKRLTVRGSTLRAQPLDVKAVLAHALHEKIVPALDSGGLKFTIDSTFALHDAINAHKYVEANQNLGKVMLSAQKGSG